MRLNVHGWIADDPTESEAENYVPVICTACTRTHLVNPKTVTRHVVLKINIGQLLPAAVLDDKAGA